MPRKIILLLVFSFALYSAAHAARPAKRFAGLEKKLKVIANKYYGFQTLPGYSIGIAFQDVKTGYRISVRGNKIFPAASIIKLPVMACLFYMADRNLATLESKVAFTEADKLHGAGVLQWLKPNTYTLWNLCRMMISLSDNTATRLVVNKITKSNVNRYCRNIGLKNTFLVDETALAEAPEKNINLTTPIDMAKLLRRIELGSGFSKKSRKDMIAFMLNQKYTFGIPRVLPKGFRAANKTGNLTNVLHDCAIVYSPRGTYILIVFTKGFKTDRRGHDRYARLVINAVSEAVAGYYK